MGAGFPADPVPTLGNQPRTVRAVLAVCGVCARLGGMIFVVANLKGGVGKALAATEPVLTPTGFRPIGSLRESELVIGSDGLSYEVLGVYPQGERDLFDVSFSDGSAVVTDAEHLWEVQTTADRGRGICRGPQCSKRFLSQGLCPGHLAQVRADQRLRPLRPCRGTVERESSGNRVMSTADLAAAGLFDERAGHGRRHRFFVPVCAPVKFEATETMIDPYLLGLLLGDGGLTNRGSVQFTSADRELVEAAEALVAPLGLRLRKTGDYSYGLAGRIVPQYSDTDLLQAVRASGAATKNGYIAWRATSQPDAPSAGVISRRFGSHRQARAQAGGLCGPGPVGWPQARRNGLVEALRSLDLMGKGSAAKFIPEDYKFGDIDTRVALLQGLLDTDGWAERVAAGFCTVSAQLADDVAFVAQSLGCVVTRSTTRPSYRHRDELRRGLPAYRLRIKPAANLALFRLTRKLARISEGQRRPYRAVTAITPAGRGEAVCIEVASPDRLYLTRNLIPTHNTTTAVYLAAAAARQGPVLLVDADPQASAAEWLEQAPIEGVQLVEAPSERLVARAAALGDGATVIIDTPPGSERIVRAALDVAHAAVIPTRAGGVEVSRVQATLGIIPSSLPRGLVICAARTHTRDYRDTATAWPEAGVEVWATIPERVAIAAGPDGPLHPDGLDAYTAVLTAASR